MIDGDGTRITPKGQNIPGIDRTRVRLAVLGILVVAAFVALFSRLWFLQVLASEQYRGLARENQVRLVESEPPRGEILDRKGKKLVSNRPSLALTIDKQQLTDPGETRIVLGRIADLINEPAKFRLSRFERAIGKDKSSRPKQMTKQQRRRLRKLGDAVVTMEELETNLNDATFSPYKPVPVAFDVREKDALYISEHPDLFPGVGDDLLPVRVYPQGKLAAHILGRVAEISQEELDSDHFRDRGDIEYQPGDFVGKEGVEYVYDRYLRGVPEVRKVVVNSAGDVVESEKIQEERSGGDLILSVDARIQRMVERSLESGIFAARGAFQAPAGAAVVMDPNTGQVVAMGSYPTYDPRILADGITVQEYDRLGDKTRRDPDDDALLNRAIQAQRQPGSTFKVVTSGAAFATNIFNAYDTLPCPSSKAYPPDNPNATIFNNWTTIDMGAMDTAYALTISCDTFFYELGWQLETTFDEEEAFQKYIRDAGFGDETGVDLPNEADGRVPDRKWCRVMKRETKGDICALGWLPGYSVNMAIGQGDLIVTPIQMAVTYAALVNGGVVWQPRVGMKLTKNNEQGRPQLVERFDAPASAQLSLDATEFGIIQQGLNGVVGNGNGTARAAFSGFPLSSFPVAGKTGTAELGETGQSDAWFISYGPAYGPEYVIAVYVEKAGHGGETAAPIARDIWEGIAGIDSVPDVRLGSDNST